MKKNAILTILLLLIIALLVVLGLKIYENYNLEDVEKNIYSFEDYPLYIEDYNFINSEISNNKIYLLYKNNDDYLLKELDTLSKKENVYSKNINMTCNLKNDYDNPYIVCKDKSKISVYNKNLELQEERKLITENDYAVKSSIYENNFNEYPEVVNSICNLKCLLIRKDIITNKINLYKENILKEENIKNYDIFENGVLTYNDDKIKIYNVNNDFKEFKSPLENLTSKIVHLSKNEYNLYVLENKEIDVYNLYEKSKTARIDIYKIKEKVKRIKVYDNKLYVFTDKNFYIYDVFDIEENLNKENLFENDYIGNKVTEIKEKYSINVNLKESINIMHKDYNITEVNNYNDIINALSYLEDYLLIFNKDFFKRFYEYDMNGLNIYFAYDITGGELETSTTDVVGLSFVKGNEYVIIIKLNSKANLLTILTHETMHIIDLYLELRDFSYNWNDLNPEYFTYQNVYYPNVVYKDVLETGKFKEEIYFIDNYARTNEKEDRARLFEKICACKNYEDYPNLNNKMNYLKKVLTVIFPEISYIKAFE
mgnify:FL=1